MTLALCAGALLFSACGKEGPSALAGPLVPEGAVRTYELLLDATSFLVNDASFGGYSRTSEAGFYVLAKSFEGVVDANILVRFVHTPPTLSIVDSAGVGRQDTLPRFFGGHVVVNLDTTLTPTTTALQFALYRTTEQWDAATATWALRVDTGGVQLPWTQPGGTRGPLVSTATLDPGGDSIVFNVDSATLVAWNDTTDATRGALIVAVTPNARVHALSVGLQAQAHSSLNKDTVVTVTTGNLASTFIFTPEAPPSTALRVGGTPAHRSYFVFRDNLDSLAVPCPSGRPGCQVLLKNATVNYAALVLQALPTAPGFALEDSVYIGAYPAFPSPALPLSRSPLGSITGRSTFKVRPDQFAGAAGSTIEVPITSFVSVLAAPRDTTSTSNAARSTAIALLSAPENATFGFSTFAGRTAVTGAPKLRLVVTVATEVQLP
jgi:hypothetical protein